MIIAKNNCRLAASNFLGVIAVAALVLGFSAKSFSRDVEPGMAFIQAVSVTDTIVTNIATSKVDTVAGVGTVFFLVEEMPKFNYKEENELQSFRNYITDNLQWPENMDGIQGRVFVSFIVEVDGRISTIKIVRSVDKSKDNEVIRVIAHAPRWIPGKQKGSPVRVTYTIPVTFQLQ